MSTELKTNLGTIEIVDTNSVIIKVTDEKLLNKVQVNDLVKIRSSRRGENTISLVTKIMRRSKDKIDEDSSEELAVDNVIKASLIGTHIGKDGKTKNVFKRTINALPNLGTDCFLLKGDNLSEFMRSISIKGEETQKLLNLGKYTISDKADAYLDGNKFFQRHAVIVGGTGSGKSWTVAEILAQASKLQSVNCIIFDIHGEYQPLKQLKNTTSLRIAGPTDNTEDEKVIYLPYWLLTYEEIQEMLLDRSDLNAPNQARLLFQLIIEYKEAYIKSENKLFDITIDSPVPYDIEEVLKELKDKDKGMVPGVNKGSIKGPYHGKLTRFIQRLETKKSDKRLNFLFNNEESLCQYDWFEKLIKKLMDFGNKKGIKIIDFSEVPSDILSLITGLVARLIFSIQQWTDKDKRHPIALFCDEGHLYIPADANSSVGDKGLRNFERIAKEGRKYGVSLVVISQRPADVSKTVLSQCGNFVAMRLSNPEDQNVIRRLFPDSLGNFSDLLPILDIGECLVVGDACLLPSRVRVNEPQIKPASATIDFWTEWAEEDKSNVLPEACEALRKQSKQKKDEVLAVKMEKDKETQQEN